MPEYNSNIDALNDILGDYGLAGGHNFERSALNAWAVHLGGAGGHRFTIDAYNEIAVLMGGSGGHQFDIDAANEICGLLGGLSNYEFVEDALSAISDLPVFSTGTIQLSASTIAEDAADNSVVGILSVVDGSGTYTFSITADPDNKFAIANGNELRIDELLDYETATSHLVTIEADNGVAAPLSQQFTINVADVVGAMEMLSGESAGMALDFTGNNGLGFAAVKGHTTNLNNVPVDQFLTQAGTSPKLVRNAAGVYVWSAHNNVIRSQTFEDAAWTKQTNVTATDDAVVAPDGTTTGCQIDWAAAANNTGIFSTGWSTFSGAVHTFAVWIRADAAGGTVGLTDASFPAPETTVNLTTSWQLATLTLATGATPLLWVRRKADSPDTIYIAAAQANRGTVPTAYMATTTAARFAVPLEYDGGYYALVEPAATNAILRSKEFDNVLWTASAWGTGTGDAPTVTANAAIAPNGVQEADLISIPARSASTRLQELYQSFTGTAVAWTGSLFVKAETAGDVGKEIELGMWNGSAYAGTLVITLTAVWQRVEKSATLVATACAMDFGRSVAGLTADLSAVGFYVWQAGVELGTVATSPIPTVGATVTRAADNISVATSAFPFSTTVGTMYADMFVNGQIAAVVLWNLWQDANNLIQVYKSASGAGDLAKMFVYTAASIAADDGPAGSILGADVQATFGWKLNDFGISKNGGAVVADTSGAVPGSSTRLEIGTQNGLAGINARISKLIYVPRRVIDADLPTWRYVA